MKIDLKQVVKDHKGNPCKHGADDATLGLLAYAALDNLTQAEANLATAQKMIRGRLAQRIVAADGIIDLKAEEIALIKQCIGNSFGPWVIAQTEDMLEGEPKLSSVKSE